VGGTVLGTVARGALERQIRLRLDGEAANIHRLVDKDLELLGRRVEDFASDGHIRLELERLQAPGGGAAEAARGRPAEELVWHLRTNKLPLVAEFADAYVLDRSGKVVARAWSRTASPAAGFNRAGFWYGPLTAPTPALPHPTFVLSTPVRSLDGTRRLGYLQIVVRADLLAGRMRRILTRESLRGMRVGLSSPDGYRLPLFPGDASGVVPDRLEFSSANPRTGWNVDLSIDRRLATLPVSVLVSTFVAINIALVVLALLLFLPSRFFLLEPLAALERAARRITEGDFSARAGYRSGDEVGHLAEAFDLMAAATEERTRKLAQAAEDLRHREAEIRFERDRLDTVIQSMEDGLFILDRNGGVSLANTSARGVLDALGTGLHDAEPEQCAGRRGVLPRSCLACLGDYRHLAKPCTVAVGARTYEIRTTPLPGLDGREAARIVVSRDVTERRRQAAQQAHQERISVLGEIAAVMAHELNNPLSAISMFNQMMLDKLDPSSPLYSHAEVIHRNMLGCKRIIRSMLDMAATSSAGREDFDVRDLVDEVADLLRPVAIQSGTALRIDSKAEDGSIHANELQLRQALINLVMNAIQSTGKRQDGQVAVGSENRGGDIVLRVRDNGPGIPDELRERVFEPFFTTKPPGEGTGLGLPTTRRIIETHGGRLILGRGPDGGAVFEVIIPRRIPLREDRETEMSGAVTLEETF
jgi:signal transduction histidine kinase